MRVIVCSLVAFSFSLGANVNAAIGFNYATIANQTIAASANAPVANRTDPLSEDTDSAQAANPLSATADHYPHIACLEKTILGQTYPGQDLRARLARMEAKALASHPPIPI